MNMKALFIGRFQPFHKGHAEQIRLISKKYEEIIIGIGSAQRSHTIENPFTAAERTAMIKEFLKDEGIKKYQIFEIRDLNVIWSSTNTNLIVWSEYLNENIQEDTNKVTLEIIQSDGIDTSKGEELILSSIGKEDFKLAAQDASKVRWSYLFDVVSSIISSEDSSIVAQIPKDKLIEWVDYVLSCVPEFDVVYSNNQLTKELFSKKGYDVKETTLFNRNKYRGTEIRRRMIHNETWEDLVPEAVATIIKDIDGVKRVKGLSH
jgi:cytidyltransferase-like protein